MTVIAYSSKHRVMAADSRCSDSTTLSHVTNCQKVFRLRSGGLLGMAGDADARDAQSLLERATARKMPSRLALAELRCDVTAILVFPKGEIFQVTATWLEHESEGEWIGEVLPMGGPLVAIGSGAHYAMGAMECGASPGEAVRIACKHNLMCALPVQMEPLLRNKKTRGPKS